MQTSARMVEYFSGSAFEDKFAQTERSIKRLACGVEQMSMLCWSTGVMEKVKPYEYFSGLLSWLSIMRKWNSIAVTTLQK